MRVLLPVLSPEDANGPLIEQTLQDASVVYVLLVLDRFSPSSKFGFKASDIMLGRETVEKVKDEIKKRKRLCNDIMEWGHTLEKIAQIAEMKQVEKIVLFNSQNSEHFVHTVNDLQKLTKIPVHVIPKG